MNSNIDYYKYINRIKFNITNCNKITDTDIEYGTKFRYMCFKFFVKKLFESTSCNSYNCDNSVSICDMA